MGRSRLSVALISVVLGLAACSASSNPADSDPDTPVESDGTSDSATPVTPQGPITLALAGDVHFTGRTERFPNDPAPMVEALAPLAEADLAVLNLETAITERGRPEPKEYHFRAPASSLDALAEAGIDAVSLANNHSVDYGPDGLADSVQAKADSPIPVVGFGENIDAAYAPALLEAKGRTVAVIGATQIGDRTMQVWSATEDSAGVASARNVERLTQAVRDARAQADVVVVYLHWGRERMGCPTEDQKSLAGTLAEAGADVIAGTHAHRLQGAGWLHSDSAAGTNGTDGTESTAPASAYVSYGLGNFIWYHSRPVSATTGVLTLTLDGRDTTAAAWTPMVIGSDGLPGVVSGSQGEAAVSAWNETRGCTDLSDSPR